MILIDNQFLPYAQSLISAARNEIDITTYNVEYTTHTRGVKLSEFFRTLIAASKGGVRVRFLLHWRTSRAGVILSTKYAVREFKKKNLDVRFLKNNRCCHAKILIVDRQVAIVGSHNLSVASCYRNFEVSNTISAPPALAKLAEVFETNWRYSLKI